MMQELEESGGGLAGVLSWSHDVRRVDQQGIEIVRAASPAELAGVAAALSVLSCDDLEVRYTLLPAGKARYQLTGVIDLTVTQACVVTLESIGARHSEKFSVELWPREEMPTIETRIVEDLEGDDIEPIDNGVIQIGRIVLEYAACMIDPYPRKADATFSWVDETTKASDRSNPFAKLKELRRKP